MQGALQLEEGDDSCQGRENARTASNWRVSRDYSRIDALFEVSPALFFHWGPGNSHEWKQSEGVVFKPSTSQGKSWLRLFVRHRKNCRIVDILRRTRKMRNWSDLDFATKGNQCVTLPHVPKLLPFCELSSIDVTSHLDPWDQVLTGNAVVHPEELDFTHLFPKPSLWCVGSVRVYLRKSDKVFLPWRALNSIGLVQTEQDKLWFNCSGLQFQQTCRNKPHWIAFSARNIESFTLVCQSPGLAHAHLQCGWHEVGSQREKVGPFPIICEKTCGSLPMREHFFVEGFFVENEKLFFWMMSRVTCRLCELGKLRSPVRCCESAGKGIRSQSASHAIEEHSPAACFLPKVQERQTEKFGKMIQLDTAVLVLIPNRTRWCFHACPIKMVCAFILLNWWARDVARTESFQINTVLSSFIFQKLWRPPCFQQLIFWKPF